MASGQSATRCTPALCGVPALRSASARSASAMSLSNCTKVKLALVPYLRTDSAISLICTYSTGAWTRPPSAPSKTGNACCIFLCGRNTWREIRRKRGKREKKKDQLAEVSRKRSLCSSLDGLGEPALSSSEADEEFSSEETDWEEEAAHYEKKGYQPGKVLANQLTVFTDRLGNFFNL